MEVKPIERPNTFPKKITLSYINNVSHAFNRLIETPIIEKDDVALPVDFPPDLFSVKGTRPITKKDYELLAPFMDSEKETKYTINKDNQLRTRGYTVPHELKTRNGKMYIHVLSDDSLRDMRDLIDSIRNYFILDQNEG